MKVDSLVPGKDAYKVHADYAVKLNQTNIGGNNNKYYIIQLLEKAGSYYVWTRWGRVGEPGQNKLDGKGGNLAAAIKGFEQKFREKTVNHWGDKASFVKHDGKYQLVETEEKGDGGGDDDVPLGQLTKAQIEKGQVVLKNIETAIGGGNKKVLNDLSSQFFSLIPTDFGRKRPEPIVTMDVLHAKEALLDFYLRMGFEDMKEDVGCTPISGVMDLPCPPSLKAAAATICGDGDIVKCVTKGNELAVKQVGKPKRKCNGELYGSILLYTSNAIYAALNKALRDENRAAVKKYFQYLRLFLEAFDVLPQQNCKLWRGISVDLYDQYKVGNTITWWSVSSCTSDESVARGFAAGCGGNCTMITLNAKTACDISQVTFFAHEKESLLAPGTQLKVVSSKKVGKVTEIHMEEVGRCLK
jgi:predicted DNA-binding WGR domain protein